MFLLRSAFWLIAAMLVFQQGGLNLPAAARGFGDAVAAGSKQDALTTIPGIVCLSVDCQALAGSVLAGRTSAKADLPNGVEELVPVELAPMPLPRLIRKG